MKDIKRRIKSVESTGQITKAMELVASSKLKKAKERAEQASPFFDTLYRTISDIAAMNTEDVSVYTKKREVKASLFIVIAGDRGLAGGYNNNIFKLADAAMEGKNPKIIAIGKKACDRYEKTGNVVQGFAGVAEELDKIRVDRIANLVVSLFKEDKVQEVFIYYTQFVSALSQQPLELRVLPLENLGGEKPKQTEQVTYEPSPQAVFDSIVPDYISGVLFGAVLESYASEQGARRTAMESANDNAEEMIGNLSLKYNRARQAAITQEISEIVSGAGAL